MAKTSGKYLNELYSSAWKKGLKTTYYLRSLGASQVEKSTVDTAKYGNTHKRGGIETEGMLSNSDFTLQDQCAIDDPECEACQ